MLWAWPKENVEGLGAPFLLLLFHSAFGFFCGARRISKSDERESCINVSGLLVEQILLRTIMGIRAHPG